MDRFDRDLIPHDGVSDCFASSFWNGDFVKVVENFQNFEAVTQSQTKDQDSEGLSSLISIELADKIVIGASALNVFLQSNVTGPKLPENFDNGVYNKLSFIVTKDTDYANISDIAENHDHSHNGTRQLRNKRGSLIKQVKWNVNESDDNVINVVTRDEDILSLLEIDGEPVYERIKNPKLLLLADFLLNQAVHESTSNCNLNLNFFARIWLSRVKFSWQRSLAEASDRGTGHSPTLFESSVMDFGRLLKKSSLLKPQIFTLNEGELKCRPDGSKGFDLLERINIQKELDEIFSTIESDSQDNGTNENDQNQNLNLSDSSITVLLCELCVRCCWYQCIRPEALEYLLEILACTRIGFEYRFTGIKGIRRKYQTQKIAQLVLVTRSEISSKSNCSSTQVNVGAAKDKHNTVTPKNEQNYSTLPSIKEDNVIKECRLSSESNSNKQDTNTNHDDTEVPQLDGLQIAQKEAKHTNRPATLKLDNLDPNNDILETPKFKQNSENSETILLESGNTSICKTQDIINKSEELEFEYSSVLPAVQQTVLLALGHFLWTHHAKRDALMLEQLNAVCQRMLVTKQNDKVDDTLNDQQIPDESKANFNNDKSTQNDNNDPDSELNMLTANWLVFSAALYFRCKAEIRRVHTRERSVLQLQALVEQFYDDQPSARHRLLYVFSSGYSSRHELQREFGISMRNIGMVVTAYEHFLSLGMWADAVDCLIVADRRRDAIALLTEKLNMTETGENKITKNLKDIDDIPELEKEACEDFPDDVMSMFGSSSEGGKSDINEKSPDESQNVSNNTSSLKKSKNVESKSQPQTHESHDHNVPRARLLCCLGDLASDNNPQDGFTRSAESFYRQAWDESAQRYARAMRSLAQLFFRRALKMPVVQKSEINKSDLALESDSVLESQSDRNHLLKLAAKSFRDALNVNAVHPSSWFSYGCVLMRLGSEDSDSDNDSEFFKNAAHAFRKSIQYRQMLGGCSKNGGSIAANISGSDEANFEETGEDGVTAECYGNLAACLVQLNEYKEALIAIKEGCRKSNHRDGRMWETRMSIALYLRDIQEICKCIRQLTVVLRQSIGGAVDLNILALLVADVLRRKEEIENSNKIIQSNVNASPGTVTNSDVDELEVEQVELQEDFLQAMIKQNDADLVQENDLDLSDSNFETPSKQNQNHSTTLEPTTEIKNQTRVSLSSSTESLPKKCLESDKGFSNHKKEIDCLQKDLTKVRDTLIDVSNAATDGKNNLAISSAPHNMYMVQAAIYRLLALLSANEHCQGKSSNDTESNRSKSELESEGPREKALDYRMKEYRQLNCSIWDRPATNALTLPDSSCFLKHSTESQCYASRKINTDIPSIRSFKSASRSVLGQQLLCLLDNADALVALNGENGPKTGIVKMSIKNSARKVKKLHQDFDSNSYISESMVSVIESETTDKTVDKNKESSESSETVTDPKEARQCLNEYICWIARELDKLSEKI